jgi:hypothetical protein
MEPSISSPGTIAPRRADQIVESLARQRAELEAFLAGHRERLSSAEANLTGQIQRIAADLASDREEVRRTEDAQSVRGEQLATEAETLGALRQTLEAIQAAWRQSQEESAEHQRQRDERIHSREEAIAKRLDELMDLQTHVAESEAQLRADEQRLALARAEVEREQEALAEARRALDAQRNELDARQRQVEARQAETEQQRRHIARELQKKRAAAERDVQRMRCEVESSTTTASPAAAPKKTPSPATSFPGSSGWELQKQQLLAALEGMEEGREPGERQRIEDLVRKTDEAIAAKDREIVELRALVERGGGRAVRTAAETVALADGGGHDAAVEQERERLRTLQAELLEKLRQSEIEVSIERAEIARQRVEIEEIMRQFAEEKAAGDAARGASAAEGGKSPSRRWLTRLGLQSPEDEAT